ncbi:MAG TPA: sugar ABC transporter permease [Actinomycetes bacterium]|nr:sugar ABC transporter permease [Actinomycetes bacterium]
MLFTLLAAGTGAKAGQAVVTVMLGLAAALALYWVLNKVVELLPGVWEDRTKPYAYILPAFLAITVYLIYPAIRTIFLSFKNADSTKFIGFKNYSQLLTSHDFQQALLNTLLWIIIVPAMSIILGLIVAVLADRLSPNSEKLSKTIIFLPMAISAVGASTVWAFVYAYEAPGQVQIGIQNALWTALGNKPVAWLSVQTLHFNSLLLMVMMLWLQVGFSMVLLSAAIKAVPVDTLEAARIDGANERQIFGRVVIPQIMPTIITVLVTVVITVMKVFDVVYVMTNGNYNTNVIGLEFFNELFTDLNNGYAAAIVVMLMVAVIPLMIYQVRQFRAQEAAR